MGGRVAPGYSPQFDRVRPYHPALRIGSTTVPPGIPIGLGIDVGPALIHVSASMVGSWSMTLADVTACALANLHERAAKVRPGGGGLGHHRRCPDRLAQTGLSIGAALVPAPQEPAAEFPAPGPGSSSPHARPPSRCRRRRCAPRPGCTTASRAADPNCLHPRACTCSTGTPSRWPAVGAASPVATG
ncbi:MAG: hypothetical protein R3C32_06605 [Chloroflexota bacterium]